jgi:hypothetical protein
MVIQVQAPAGTWLGNLTDVASAAMMDGRRMGMPGFGLAVSVRLAVVPAVLANGP